MRILLFGSDKFHALYRTALTDLGHSVSTSSPFSSDLLYFAYASHALSKPGLSLVLLFLAQRKPIIFHWVGSDVLDVNGDGEVNSSNQRLRRLAFRILSQYSRAWHFAGADHLQKELRLLGLESRVVPVPGYPVQFDPRPLPSRPAVLTYVPEHREEFYGLPIVLRLASSHPELSFHVTAHTGQGVNAPNNVIFHGWVDSVGMEALYDQCTCVLRLTKHDALAGTVLEGVSRGRYAIWSYPSPYSSYARDFEEADLALREITGRVEPNLDGSRYVAEHFSQNRVKELLGSELQLVLTRTSVGHKP